jgi:hypothetical protein
MNRNLAKILAVTTLIIASAGLSTASQKPQARAFQTSSNIKQSQVTQVASVSCNGEVLNQLSMTYYSYHDNSYPAGCNEKGCWEAKPNGSYDIAYRSPSSLYENAEDKKGGNGSYDSPIIAAVPPHLEECLSPGTLIYAPHLKKYLIIADQCPTSKDPNNPNEEKCIPGKNMIDVWMYTKPENHPSKVEECHNKWTDKGFEQAWDVVINPPNSKPVDTTPFFNPNTNECTKPNFS